MLPDQTMDDCTFLKIHGRCRYPEEPGEGFTAPLFRPTSDDDGRVIVDGNPFNDDSKFVLWRGDQPGRFFLFRGDQTLNIKFDYLALFTRREFQERLLSLPSPKSVGRNQTAYNLKFFCGIDVFFGRPFPFDKDFWSLAESLKMKGFRTNVFSGKLYLVSPRGEGYRKFVLAKDPTAFESFTKTAAATLRGLTILSGLGESTHED